MDSAIKKRVCSIFLLANLEPSHKRKGKVLRRQECTLSGNIFTVGSTGASSHTSTAELTTSASRGSLSRVQLGLVASSG